MTTTKMRQTYKEKPDMTYEEGNLTPKYDISELPLQKTETIDPQKRTSAVKMTNEQWHQLLEAIKNSEGDTFQNIRDDIAGQLPEAKPNVDLSSLKKTDWAIMILDFPEAVGQLFLLAIKNEIRALVARGLAGSPRVEHLYWMLEKLATDETAIKGFVVEPTEQHQKSRESELIEKFRMQRR